MTADHATAHGGRRLHRQKPGAFLIPWPLPFPPLLPPPDHRPRPRPCPPPQGKLALRFALLACARYPAGPRSPLGGCSSETLGA